MASMVEIDAQDARLRLWVYERLRDTGGALPVAAIAGELGLGEDETRAAVRRLATEHDALVLHPDGELWMAEPFSAVPTTFRVRSGSRAWWGNCIWDALGILALLELDGSVTTACPDCDEPLVVEIEGGALREPAGGAVAHFLVPARDWWRDIGFT